MLIALLTAQAFAYTNPDRPSVSMSSNLIEPNSMELESGFFWHRDDGGNTPLRLKYAYENIFELRLDGNPLGAVNGGPGLVLGSKIPVASGDAGTFTAFLGSALPVTTNESWSADAMLLYGKGVEGFGLTVNVGVRLAANNGVGLAGLPMVVALGLPAPEKMSWFIEGATLFNQGFESSVFDGGILFDVTTQVTLDVGAGYYLDVGAPFAQVGATFNFGQLH